MIHQPGTVFYVRQQEPAGLGHAVWCARHLINDEPVAVLLADDLIIGSCCMEEMVTAYKRRQYGCGNGRSKIRYRFLWHCYPEER